MGARVYKIKKGKAIGVRDRDKKSAAHAMKKHTAKKKPRPKPKPKPTITPAQGADPWINKPKQPTQPPTTTTTTTTQPTPQSGKPQSVMRKATGKESFAMTKPGQMWSGLKQAFGFQNQSTDDIQTLPLAQQIGLVGGLAAAGGRGRYFGSVAKLSKLGRINPQKVLTAAQFATNTKTAAITRSWLTKLSSAAANPAVVVGGLMAAIGSYPFAGFIKEEALQTVGFATKTAMDAGDIEGTAASIELQKQILDPDLWGSIMGKIPTINVMRELYKFYDASRLKLAIDEKKFEDMKIQLETGETNDQKYARIRQEEINQQQEITDYRNSERKMMFDYEQEARAAARAATRTNEINARNADANFWAKEKEKQREYEAEDRKAIADFWAEYKKSQQKLSADNRPSNLKFGLL